ncbi:DUF2270 domain-containing protein [Halomarina ordinaria]|uniref:DUF2270 domain-containing protein n=1 Tax=Halomarina ordinaria TaxID=3033939 RepID=A0ABD5U5S9_9EURY|nr:DUF2270 domain-containing protein [Halomarina sp. PSRA2]
MTPETTDFDPNDPEARDVASDAAADREEFLSLLPHYYRGETARMSALLDRIDLTVDWAIAVIVALLALSFNATDRPPYLLLIAMAALVMFLVFDVRRYRTFDATRARVRMLEENVFANAFSPEGAEHEGWRAELSADLRRPTLKVSVQEAAGRRLRRVYLPLLTVLVVAWLYRITVYVPGEAWTATASVPGVPGTVVAALVAAAYLAAFALAYWPYSREARGEFHGEDAGEWKQSD